MANIFLILEKNGLIHILRTSYVCLIEPVFMRGLQLYLKLYKKIRELKKKRNLNREFNAWRAKKEELLQQKQKGYQLKIEDLGLEPENLNRLKKAQQLSPEVVIADIDQDGFLLSYFGPISETPTISEDQFLTRNRFGVKVVAVGGYVGVKKSYKGSKSRFINELEALYQLGLTGCNAPVIMDADFDNLTLTFSYIPGPVLSQELAKKGAVLHRRDVRHTDYSNLPRKQRRPIRIQEGKRVLYDVVDEQFVDQIFAELSKIHAAGVIGNDVKYGNVIIERDTSQPYWIDFEHAPYYPNLSEHASRILRDPDIKNFNLFFDTKKVTYKNLKSRIASHNIPALNHWTIPVYFGSGLRIGSLWQVESGYGCWHYLLKHHLPLLSGKRILDIGANNAFYGLQMLRQGAREVIGIETDDNHISQGNFVKAAFEWADNTQYNFSYIQADVIELPTLHLGNFDLVTAFSAWCYFAQPDRVSNLAQYLHTITDTFILQGHVEPDTNGNYPDSDPQMSIEDVAQALRDNGFPATRLVAPRGYRRPLIVAGKTQQLLH